MKLQILNKYVDDGWVEKKKHPTEELYIYNYTQKVQFERLWDTVTIQCRGLILDAEGKIIARPFSKFFNIEEHEAEEIPNLPFEVFEKMDGSLGILYWLNGSPRIATRGSFSGVQAVHATQILHGKYAGILKNIDKNKTYLFEIIYPENRIVIDYNTLDDLILLAIIDTKTGQDLPLEEIGFPIVKKYDGMDDFNSLKALNTSNKEGFVIKFSNGFRIKVKFEEYLRLHKILTKISTNSIWELLATQGSFEELYNHTPDEFFKWIEKEKSTLEKQFFEIKSNTLDLFYHKPNFETRKDFAIWAMQQKYPKLLFAVYTNKNLDKLIWRIIKPEYRKLGC